MATNYLQVTTATGVVNPNQVARVDPPNALGQVNVCIIPADPGNRDWRDYQEWLAQGNTPAPPTVV